MKKFMWFRNLLLTVVLFDLVFYLVVRYISAPGARQIQFWYVNAGLVGFWVALRPIFEQGPCTDMDKKRVRRILVSELVLVVMVVSILSSIALILWGGVLKPLSIVAPKVATDPDYHPIMMIESNRLMLKIFAVAMLVQIFCYLTLVTWNEVPEKTIARFPNGRFLKPGSTFQVFVSFGQEPPSYFREEVQVYAENFRVVFKDTPTLTPSFLLRVRTQLNLSTLSSEQLARLDLEAVNQLAKDSLFQFLKTWAAEHSTQEFLSRVWQPFNINLGNGLVLRWCETGPTKNFFTTQDLLAA